MNSDAFEKLQHRLDDLLNKFERLKAEKLDVEQGYLQLKEQVKTLEARVKTLQDDNKRMEKSLDERGEAALKKISRLVDKIDQFQSEMKFS